ncbi:response regulator [Lyngbya confervoides]|uniref:Response regulator n=1 Tax=Lyngbya confervoides BDU141951 TaxID=1574623 RepID=A0ABD4T6Y2_9CYAN|nr:response regulator [Lyngbya confervoides]MCM1984208.1 response regulator [Lyngbya confervoides BDU141951]
MKKTSDAQFHLAKEVAADGQLHQLEPCTMPSQALSGWTPGHLCVVGTPNVVLLKLLAEHRSGSLTMRDPDDPSVEWRIHLDQGKIVFAESTMGLRDRLSYVISRLNLEEASWQWPAGGSLSSSYALLCQIWTQAGWPASMLQKALAFSTQEALVQIFALRRCQIVYHAESYFPPVIKSDSFSSLVNPIEPWISQWRGMRREIKSPFQRLYIQNWDKLFQLISYAHARYPRLSKLNLGLGKNFSLYQLAAHLQFDAQELAVTIHPLIKAGAVGVRPFQKAPEAQRPLVASINESALIQKLTERTLERSGFDVLALSNPHQALNVLSKAKPALTILDSQLSQANGFEICRRMRSSESLKSMPIIFMLRERELFGQTRVRLAGANAFLSSPIRPQDLINCVNQWVERPRKDRRSL